MKSRSCQWKRPSVGAQKNEFGERHEVLTTIGCEVKSIKPRARNLFRFMQSRPISNELYISYPPTDDGKTFNMNENYSIKFRKGIHGSAQIILTGHGRGHTRDGPSSYGPSIPISEVVITSKRIQQSNMLLVSFDLRKAFGLISGAT